MFFVKIHARRWDAPIIVSAEKVMFEQVPDGRVSVAVDSESALYFELNDEWSESVSLLGAADVLGLEVEIEDIKSGKMLEHGMIKQFGHDDGRACVETVEGGCYYLDSIKMAGV